MPLGMMPLMRNVGCHCGTCSKSFASPFSLRRHAATMHNTPMNNQSISLNNQGQNTSNQASLKRGRGYDGNNDDDSEKKTKRRCKYFYPIAAHAYEYTEDKIEEMVKGSKDPDEAREEAIADMADKHEKHFFRVYKDFIIKGLYTRKSKLHQKVMDHATGLHKHDVPADFAAKMAIRKYRDEFEASTYVEHAAIYIDSENEEDEDYEADTSDEEEEEDAGDGSDGDEVEDKESSNSEASSDNDA